MPRSGQSPFGQTPPWVLILEQQFGIMFVYLPNKTRGWRDGMKIACVLITHLPAKAELRRRAGLRDKPVIITTRSSHGLLVLDVSPQVAGVVAGMPLQEAMSRCKGATLLEADEPHYRLVFDRIIDSLSQRSPVIEKGGLGCAYVDVTGLEAMYRGEANVIVALLNAVPAEFNARLGLARTKFPARVAAVMSDGGQATRVPSDVPGFLAKLPVDLLPLSWDSVVKLRRFGLHTIGQVASLPVGPLQAQFGSEGRVAWELANGIDRSRLAVHKQEQVVSESLTFPSPATTLHAILPAIETLLGRAFSHPAVKGKYVRLASIEAQVMRRPPWTRSFAFKEALNSKSRALLALRAMLETAKMPGPLEEMKLTLSGITGESGIQSGLFPDVRRRAQLGETMRQLEARLRTRPPIYKVMEVEPWSRLPERRQALVQFEP